MNEEWIPYKGFSEPSITMNGDKLTVSWQPKTYKTWLAMRSRCLCKSAGNYSLYGGRGILIDPRWNRYSNFLRDMGECPEGRTLDRINVNGNYEPSNCRWATVEQQSNNRRKHRWVTFRGRTQTVALWSRELGISHANICQRLNRGWSDEDTLTKPISKVRTEP